MVTNEGLGLYIVISFASSLIINFLFYRLIFRKMKRMRGNGFSWLTTLVIILGANFGVLFIFVPNLINNFFSLGPLEKILVYLVAPISWFVFPSLITLLRAIFIKISKKREREILSKDIETAEFIPNNTHNAQLNDNSR